MLDSIHHKNIPTTKQRPNGAPLAGLDWTGLHCSARRSCWLTPAQEMVVYILEWHSKRQCSRFSSFIFDIGNGTVLAMVHAMGRTLVLPLKQQRMLYLVHGNSQSTNDV
jgi:hypothetical protein